jgi:hypothetical protein
VPPSDQAGWWKRFCSFVSSTWGWLAGSIKTFIEFTNKDGVRLVAPTLLFMGVSHGFFWTTVTFLDAWTMPWYIERHPQVTTNIAICLETLPDGVCGRLLEHLTLVQQRAQHHYEISRTFQTYQFGFLSTAFWAGTMLALGLFAVVRKGFDDLGSWGKGMMMGLLCAAAFFGGFPALMSIDKNIESNLDGYNAYDGMANEIRTYMRTGESITGNHVDGPSFLHKMDTMLADLDAPRIQFDAAQVDLGKSRFLELSQEVEGGITTPTPSVSVAIPPEGVDKSTP